MLGHIFKHTEGLYISVQSNYYMFYKNIGQPKLSGFGGRLTILGNNQNNAALGTNVKQDM